MTTLRLALLGLGNVAQAFIRLLAQKADVLNEADVTVQVVGAATLSHGSAVNLAGINTGRLLQTYQAGQSIEKFHTHHRLTTALAFTEQVEADILIETMPLNPTSGQPAVDCLRTALQRGMHVITTNKSGPAFAFDELTTLAEQQQRMFLFEGTVMDGAPIFSLSRCSLPATEILGFRAILNSTTNFILTAMEEGLPPEDALRQAQALGIAEKEPEHDLSGLDSAVKTAILINALMKETIKPDKIPCIGTQHLTTRTVIEAARQGRRFKLLAEARRRDGKIVARVNPKMMPLTNPLAHVSGSATALTLITDTLGDITIHLNEGELPQTAYAILADLLTLIRTHYA